MVMMRLPDAEKNAFHAFGSANFFWGRTQTPRMDFTTSMLAGSGSARHGTVCPQAKNPSYVPGIVSRCGAGPDLVAGRPGPRHQVHR